ncbi:MAG: YceD family protein [Nitrincola sp.]|nr:YceD family protein [Nitrincola sp.]
MSNGPLPKKADPRKLAERGAKITGIAEISAMPRLASYLCSEQGAVDVTLEFAVDEQHLRTVSGSAVGQVFMTCQRCLEPVAIDVKASLNLAVVLNDEQARNLPRYFDPLLVEEEDVALLPIIEDELILSLPSVPKHQDCSVKTSWGETESVHLQQEKPNPFSVLAALKNKAD